MTLARTAPKAKPFPVPPGLQPLLQRGWVILAINWVFQGMRGMDRKELGCRLALSVGLAVLIGAALVRGTGIGGVPAAALGLFTAHSLQFLLNGQLWVCARYGRHYRGSAARVEAATAALADALARIGWLDEVVLIGSRARGSRATDRSDIDLRLITPPGLLGLLRTNLLLVRLRARAAFDRVPLDLYAYDRPESLFRFDQAEPLLLILDRQGRLARLFPTRAVPLDEGHHEERRSA